MSRKPYQRQQGEFELRVLKDGRLVMIAPDETLLEIGRAMEEQDRCETADSTQQETPPEHVD